MKREDVYKLIDGERNHQDSKWPQNPKLPPSDEIRLVKVIANLADSEWYTTQDEIIDGIKVNPADLVAARKIAAVCVRLMENYTTPPRTI